ncbi:MAG: hypothetical protein FWF79_09700 [Defluviitaleaceae bacterium]|nr:hypothetical protein [Defluviitaleaceae bacterium]
MEIIILILFIFVGATAIVIHSNIQGRKRIKAKVLDSFGKVPDNDDLNFESIALYSQLLAENDEKNDLRTDNLTWNDLDMDKIFARINACFSSVGEEYLYDCLRRPKFNEDELLTRECLINFFDKNADSRFATAFALARVGKEDFNGIASLICCTEVKLLSRPVLYKVLALLPLIC